MANGLAVRESDAARLLRLRDGIDALERLMRASGAALEIPVVHHFAPGVYAREVTIPAGALVTGKIHRTRHLNVVSAGCIAVYSAGEGWRELRAPFSFVAEPGTRRVGYAIEDTVWTTIHGTDKTDLEELEAELIEPHDSALDVLPVLPELPVLPSYEREPEAPALCLG